MRSLAFFVFGMISKAVSVDHYKLTAPGYSQTCQEAIAMTAMSKIDNKALSQLKRLLVNKDAVDVVHWGNKVADKYKATEAYHYQPVKYNASAFKDETTPKCAELTKENITNCSKGVCLLDVLNHFFVRLAFPDSLDKYPLTYPKDMDFTDADALKLVINLMTEIHNPMAFSMDGESSPRLSHGHVDVGNQTNLKTTAYDLGRGQVCDIFAVQNSANWNSGWTHFQGLGARYFKSQEEQFGDDLEKNLDAIKSWAVETAQMRCNLMRSFNHGFNITNKDIDASFRTQFRRTLLQGGVRLSIVIQKILDVQKAGTLRKGSSVLDIPADVAYGKHHLNKPAAAAAAAPTSIFKIVAVNFSVIAIILAIGWYFLVRDPYQNDKDHGNHKEAPSFATTVGSVLGSKDKSY